MATKYRLLSENVRQKDVTAHCEQAKKNASSILAGGDSYEYIKLKPGKPIFSDSFLNQGHRLILLTTKEGMHFFVPKI